MKHDRPDRVMIALLALATVVMVVSTIWSLI